MPSPVKTTAVTASRSRIVLHRIALVAFSALLATGIALRDKEAIAFAVGVLVGVFLLAFRKGLLGRVALTLVFADTAFWMAPAALSNVRHAAEVAYVAVPVGLTAIAVAAILAAVGVGSRLVPLVILAVGVAAVGVSQIPSVGDEVARRAGDVVLSSKNVKFSRTRLRADAGRVAVRLTNHDLFWHTFTIDSPKFNVSVPVGATRRATVELPAGDYEFYCRIPGHKSAGMKGTLTVS
jgi:uncharacterized cupredoxin-like copper-binding protein